MTDVPQRPPGYPLPFLPIVIIGAARSGTKLLRDAIAASPEVAKVPYDINFIWRLGNESVPHDEFDSHAAQKANSVDIRRYLDSRRRSSEPMLVEKTVSNALRVAYVRSVVPEAYYIHLIRDGLDVIESVQRQWFSSPDWKYVFKKARAFPLRAAPRYGVSYAVSTAKRLVQPRKTTVTWGPRYEGIDDDVARLSVMQICAKQWARSIDRALDDIELLPPERVFTVRYEDFVTAPDAQLEALGRFIGTDVVRVPGRAAVPVTTGNIGKGRRRIDRTTWDEVAPFMAGALDRAGYSVPRF